MLILIVSIATSIIIGAFKFYPLNNFFQSDSKKDVSYEMRGDIIQVDSQSITVKGSAISSRPGSNYEEKKTIRFKITPATILKNKVLVLSPGKLKSGETYTPQTEDKLGVLSDLVIDAWITSIKSKENLFGTKNATAQEVNYVSYDSPRSSNSN